jgi:hypothetical protein
MISSMSEEPLRTTTFMLTRADALAYEQAASRLSPLGVIALVCWLGLFGATAMLIPDEWAGPRLGLSSAILMSIFVAIAYVLALLLIAVRQWWRARRRYRRPVEVTVTEWPDRLDFVGIGKLEPIPFSGVRRSLLTRTHLFLETDTDPVLLPRHAFPEEGAIEDLVRRIERAPRPEPGPDPSAPVDPAAPSA